MRSNIFLAFECLKDTFSIAKKVVGGRLVEPLIDGLTPDLQADFFKLTMIHNAEVVVAEKAHVSLVTRLWVKVATSTICSRKLFEYLQLAEFALCKS